MILQCTDQWPFIQVYDFDDESDIVVEYQKGGDAQSVTLYYDSDPDEYGTGLELGRDRYPLGGGVIMTMTDLAMNVDPTDSDTWTFVTNDSNERVLLPIRRRRCVPEHNIRAQSTATGPTMTGLKALTTTCT